MPPPIVVPLVLTLSPLKFKTHIKLLKKWAKMHKRQCASFPSVYPESVRSTRRLKERLNEFAVFSSATESAAIFGKFHCHKLSKFLGVHKFSF